MKVCLLTVHPTLAYKPHQMQTSACFFGQSQRLLQGRFCSQGPIGDRTVNAQQVLINDSPRSNIQVPNLTVAHLALRQAYLLAMGRQTRMWMVLYDPIKTGRLCHMYGIVVVGLTHSPTIQNDERSFFHCAAKVPPEKDRPIFCG